MYGMEINDGLEGEKMCESDKGRKETPEDQSQFCVGGDLSDAELLQLIEENESSQERGEKKSKPEEPNMPPQEEFSVQDHLFGKLSLDLLNENKRSGAIAELEIMEPNYPEAGLTLGSIFQDTKSEVAKQHYHIAADAGITQGQWGYAKMIPHSVAPDMRCEQDEEWLKYCLEAAEGCCRDAANELGLVCGSKGFHAESVYWHGFSYALEYPDGLSILKKALANWDSNGVHERNESFTKSFSEQRNKTALMIYRISTQKIDGDPVAAFLQLAKNGDDLAGLFAMKLLEQEQAEHNDSIAYKGYYALALRGNPYGRKRYADILASGKGCKPDVIRAFQYYQLSAKAGNAQAMYLLGQKAEKDDDIYLAASWYGKAVNRGFMEAGERLLVLSEG